MEYELVEYILRVSRQMAETRALEPLLNCVVEEAMKLVGAERGYVVLRKAEETLDFRVKLDKDGNEVEHAEDQISTSVLNEVIESGQPLVLQNAVNNPRFGQAKSVVFLQLRSIICVPLISRGDTIGAIYVENRAIRNRFQEEDAAPLVLFANQAAVAIENASLNDELEARVQTRTQELEAALSQLEKSWAETVEANRLRTVWLSHVAHDLRSPLGIVSGALSYIREGALGDLNDEQMEWIKKSLMSALHASSLTEDIFYLARLDEGKLKLNAEQTDVERLLKSTYEMAQGLPWEDSVELKLKIASPLPWVSLDAVRIKQVLFNLLSNAQKFTRQGSVTLKAYHAATEAHITISVADTGEGIPPDQIDQLFERFYQSDRDTKRRQKGAGLGLAICRELVEMHGGKIWAASNPGEGSEFIFTLPVKSPASR